MVKVRKLSKDSGPVQCELYSERLREPRGSDSLTSLPPPSTKKLVVLPRGSVVAERSPNR